MSDTRWCFTINNWTEEEWASFQQVDCRYIVAGQEIGPRNGVPHLQCFVIWRGRKSLSYCRNIFPRAHWERARGTSMEAAQYCKKDKNFVEFGSCPKDPGTTEKERWEAALVSAKAGRLEEIPADILIRYTGNLLKIRTLFRPPAQSLPTMDFHWYWGETGTGKSMKARTENPGYYLKNIDKWWCGYEEQDCVIIEEWYPMEGSLQTRMAYYAKQWLDHHPFLAESKGGWRGMIRPKKIIITSNYSPQECFPDERLFGPMLRRLQVLHFNNFFPLNLHLSPVEQNIVYSPSVFPEYDG